jgi:chaperone required for assembly of F1-ATPase
VKRFYTDVSVAEEDGGWGVTLDGRPVRTPARASLLLPNFALAEAVAEEWRAQGERIDPHAMPMAGLANAAIDRIAPDPAGFAAPIARYAEGDLLCYRAEEPPELVARQAAEWDPILDWARGRYDAGFVIVTGIIHIPQPAATVSRLGAALAAFDAFAMAAIHPLVTISGSLIIALALAEDALQSEAAFDAAHLDELWQAELWGEDELALEARAARRTDFTAACRFLALSRPPASA